MQEGVGQQDRVGWSLAEAFATGYLRRLSLQADELEAVPTMLRMRELTSLLHWLGRLEQGLTTVVDIEDRAHRVLGLHHWLERDGEHLVHRLGVIRDRSGAS